MFPTFDGHNDILLRLLQRPGKPRGDLADGRGQAAIWTCPA